MRVDAPVPVHLRGLPVPLHVEAARHMDALRRELDLIRHRDEDVRSVPHRLQALIDELTAEFGPMGEQPVAALEAAVERGDATVDLTYHVPPAAAEGARRLAAMLDEVDDYCRARGYLLTVVTPPASVAYRRWFLGEFVAQLAGAPPTPWSAPCDDDAPALPARPEVDDVRGPGPVGGRAGEVAVDGDAVVVTGPLDLESAPALRGVLVDRLGAGDATTVDLTACTFLDSVGVSVLVAGLLRAEEDGVELTLRLGPAARRVLEVSGLLGRFVLRDD